MGKWVPEPYLRIEIPKKDNEKRKLGLLSIKDKIVQQAIKMLVEPFFENEFIITVMGIALIKDIIKQYKGHGMNVKRKNIIIF